MKRKSSVPKIPIVLDLDFLFQHRVWQNHSKFLAKVVVTQDRKIFFGSAHNAPVITSRLKNKAALKKAYIDFYTTMFNAFTDAQAAGTRTPFDMPANMPEFSMPTFPLQRARSVNKSSSKAAKAADGDEAAKAADGDEAAKAADGDEEGEEEESEDGDEGSD